MTPSSPTITPLYNEPSIWHGFLKLTTLPSSIDRPMAFSSTTFAPLALVLLLLGSTSAQLSTNFYASSCPQVFSAVKSVVQSAIAKEKRMGASLLRLFFHDCFVQGCDGSILLDDTSNFTGEKTATPNNNSVRGFDVVDSIKAAVEKVCPGVVSCADILAITARDSVVILGGPNWNVKLGRRDSKTASFSGANNNIPPPTSSLSNLISKFAAQGLSTKDMVALSAGEGLVLFLSIFLWLAEAQSSLPELFLLSEGTTGAINYLDFVRKEKKT